MKRLSHKTAIYLDSEALKMVNYSEKEETLEATFNNGRTYHYLKVPKTLWKNFVAVIKSGESAGAFINQQIKPFYKVIEIHN